VQHIAYQGGGNDGLEHGLRIIGAADIAPVDMQPGEQRDFDIEGERAGAQFLFDEIRSQAGKQGKRGEIGIPSIIRV